MNDDELSQFARGIGKACARGLGLEVRSAADKMVPYILPALKELRRECSEATYCAYCGERFLVDAPGSAEAVGNHILTCPKHPIAELRVENACLKAALQAELKGLKGRRP